MTAITDAAESKRYFFAEKNNSCRKCMQLLKSAPSVNFQRCALNFSNPTKIYLFYIAYRKPLIILKKMHIGSYITIWPSDYWHSAKIQLTSSCIFNSSVCILVFRIGFWLYSAIQPHTVRNHPQTNIQNFGIKIQLSACCIFPSCQNPCAYIYSIVSLPCLIHLYNKLKVCSEV